MKIFHKIIPAVLIVLTLIPAIYVLCMPRETVVTRLERPGYGENESIYEINAVIDDNTYNLELTVSAMEIPMDELQSCFDRAYEFILEKMPGENESLDIVRENLVFTASVPEYGMTAEYMLDSYEIINCFGDVDCTKAEEDGSRLIVCVEIQYKEFSQSYEIPVTVYPPVYDEGDNINNAVASKINEQDGDGSRYVQLPENIHGKSVTYITTGESRAVAVVFAALCVGLILYYRKFVRRKNFLIYKEKQMSMDYSEIISKLSLLMGAGMSGAGAFAKIADDYTAAKKANKTEIRYAYEEIVNASNRISTGVSESDAYAAFGRACRLHCYIKLGNLLSQNVMKGGDGFTQMLREEAEEAFSERKALARKSGEEAGTKLLLPMAMMLGIVLVITVVPAFMSF